MKNFDIQWRTSDAPKWRSGGRVRAKSAAGALAQVAGFYADVDADSLELCATITESKAQPMPVAVRRDRATRRLVLFFWNFSRSPVGADGKTRVVRTALECYSPAEGHEEVPLEYMRDRCSPIVNDDMPAAMKLAERWAAIGPERTPFRIVRRLPRPAQGAPA